MQGALMSSDRAGLRQVLRQAQDEWVEPAQDERVEPAQDERKDPFILSLSKDRADLGGVHPEPVEGHS
jgi:hypothetical protein